MIGRGWGLLLTGCGLRGPMEDTGIDWPPAGELPRDALVVPQQLGVTFLDLDGEVLSSPVWPQLVGPCPTCAGEGASPDGDGLLLSFLTAGRNQGRPGAIARVRGNGTLDWRLDGFAFPHDVIRDPADD
ncbi:MAG: hypothetical protein AAF602_26920, partial [Myxococcota bacterium]